ncbi:MAG: serine hydrolase [Syntrophales bacterium]|nr:serine hydrolase [Syntrophales bacterium]
MKRMHSTGIKLLLTACTALFLAASAAGEAAAAAGNYKNTVATARKTLWKAITTGHGTGATVAVMDNGRIVYSEGIGVADRAANRPVDRNTRFNIGSTSKMVTAVAILLLVDDGKVKLDESVAKYIPEFRMRDPRYRKITVRMLFNHSSGLPGSSFYFGYEPDGDFHNILIDTLKDAYLKHDPGAMSIYCNDGFTLAEMIVEKVSGKKYMDFLRLRVFRPLGMKNTGPSVGEAKNIKAAEYYDVKTGKKYPREVVKVYGAGGLSSTAEDLCRFGDSFSPKGRRILSAASLKEILNPQPTPFVAKLKNRQMFGAFGWEYYSLPGYGEKGIQVLGKGGHTGFYSTNLQIVPEKRIAIGFSISGSAEGEGVTRPILDALMIDKKIMEAKTGAAGKPSVPQTVPAGLLEYAGYYANESGPVKVEFDKDRKKFTVTPLNREVKAKPLSFVYGDDVFHNPETDKCCYFAAVDGRSYIMQKAMSPFGLDFLLYQKLDAIKEPKSLKPDINGKVWLVRNVSPHISATVMPATAFTYPELPGYVDLGGIKKIESDDFASIAATALRDQSELYLFRKGGETWAKEANFLFSSADGVRKAAGGANRIVIGKDGFNEWLKIEKGAILRMEMPRKGRVLVGNTEDALYDSVVDSGEVYVPAGTYVLCAGAPGDVFTIHAR